MSASPRLLAFSFGAALSGAVLWAGAGGTAPLHEAGTGGVPGVPGSQTPGGGGLSQWPRATQGFSAPAPGGHGFYFTRAVYSGVRGRGFRSRGGSWATDYPKADRQFLVVIKRILGLDAYEFENAVSLADPALRNFPFLYALEVGGMALTQEEARGLRDYLAAGGFLVIDVFYQIPEIKQVPNVRQGRSGGPTWEQDGYEPHVLGIFDEDGRLMVVINWNTDLGDAWEWAEDPFYPLEYSTFAYEMGANLIIYGMSH